MLFSWLRRQFRRSNARLNDYKPVIMVTGCGSGLGFALAELLYSSNKYRLVITARSRSLKKLKERFPESDFLMIRELNVSIEKQRKNLVEEVERLWGCVDILINNAGISYRAVVEHMTDEDEFLQMQTNYLGPLGLTRLVLPKMREKGRGKIINVSSVSGMLAMPTMGAYSASKYALEGASEALWYEMRPLGINVSLIQPGFINSNSFKHVYYTPLSHPKRTIEGPYSDYYHHMTPFVEKMMRLSVATPEKIAKCIFNVIKKQNPPLWVAATPDALVFHLIRRILPRRWMLPVLFSFLPNARSWGKAYTRKRL